MHVSTLRCTYVCTIGQIAEPWENEVVWVLDLNSDQPRQSEVCSRCISNSEASVSEDGCHLLLRSLPGYTGRDSPGQTGHFCDWQALCHFLG